MAKTKITPDSDDVQSTAVVPVSTTAVAPYEAAADQYEDSSRDIRLPVLGLVNKVGPLADKWENKAGNFVVGEVLIGPEVRVVPVAVQKLYAEVARGGRKLEYGKDQGKLYATEAEARQAGYVVDKSYQAPNRVEEIARVNYLVFAPADCKADDFYLEAAGLKFQPAVCTYRGGAYRDVYLPLYNHAARLALVKRLPTARVPAHEVFAQTQAWTHFWTLKSTKKSNAQNTWLAPVIIKGDAVPADIAAWVESNAQSIG